MKTFCAMLVPVLLITGCTKMITVPIKVAGKTAAASVEAAGDVAAAGVKSGSKVVKSSGVDPQVVNAAVLLAK
jgi:hypothetical protein